MRVPVPARSGLRVGIGVDIPDDEHRDSRNLPVSASPRLTAEHKHRERKKRKISPTSVARFSADADAIPTCRWWSGRKRPQEQMPHLEERRIPGSRDAPGSCWCSASVTMHLHNHNTDRDARLFLDTHPPPGLNAAFNWFHYVVEKPLITEYYYNWSGIKTSHKGV